MTDITDPDPDPDPATAAEPDGGSSDGPERPRKRFTPRTLVVLIAAGAVILLLVGATAGLALGGRFSDSAPTVPSTDSVDAGFARDMTVHHDQGVLMAHYAEQNTTDPEIGVMAYDIGYTQTDQMGQMQGWLSLWDLPPFTSSARMAWMGGTGQGHSGMDMSSATATSSATSGAEVSAGPTTAGPTRASGDTAAGDTAAGDTTADTPLMPGMATDAEINKLKGLHGAESDVYFLQLMIRHHQGGTGMMQYASEHATSPVVRNFAAKMAQSQGAEISVMT